MHLSLDSAFCGLRADPAVLFTHGHKDLLIRIFLALLGGWGFVPIATECSHPKGVSARDRQATRITAHLNSETFCNHKKP